MSYHVSPWKPALKFRYRDPKKRPPHNPTGIVDKQMEFDDGKNATGYVAYRWPSGVIVKYHFHYYTGTKLVRLSVMHKAPLSGIYRKKPIENIIVEREVYMLLNREDVISESEIKKIFARFD